MPNDTPINISSIFTGNKKIKKTLATLRFLDIFDQGGSPGGFSKFIMRILLKLGMPLIMLHN